MKLTHDDPRTLSVPPALRTGGPRSLRVKTAVRAGELDPSPYQGRRSSGGYVPT